MTFRRAGDVLDAVPRRRMQLLYVHPAVKEWSGVVVRAKRSATDAPPDPTGARLETADIVLVQEVTGSPIRIASGRTWDTTLANARANHPRYLRLVAVVRGDGDLPDRLRWQFSEHRVRGDWVQPEPVLSMLRNLLPTATCLVDRTSRIPHPLLALRPLADGTIGAVGRTVPTGRVGQR